MWYVLSLSLPDVGGDVVDIDIFVDVHNEFAFWMNFHENLCRKFNSETFHLYTRKSISIRNFDRTTAKTHPRFFHLLFDHGSDQVTVLLIRKFTLLSCWLELQESAYLLFAHGPDQCTFLSPVHFSFTFFITMVLTKWQFSLSKSSLFILFSSSFYHVLTFFLSMALTTSPT